MAANFWLSSHCLRWLFTPEQIEQFYRQQPSFSVAQVKILNSHFARYIQLLGRTLKLRFRVTATAIVYFRRFYLRNAYLHCDPYLIAVAALLLASNVEEFTISSRQIVAYLQKSAEVEFPYTLQHLLECEAYLLEELNCDLVVFHPYRLIIEYLHDASASNRLLEAAWVISNDSYRTDVFLIYPPYLVALACIQMASVSLPEDVSEWMLGLNVDLAEVEQICKEFHALYDAHLRGPLSSSATVNSLLASVPRRPSLPAAAVGVGGGGGGGAGGAGGGEQLLQGARKRSARPLAPALYGVHGSGGTHPPG